ncbi:GDSL-type esterase/lipase family protein, partial [Neptuniibacter sp.]|uniref:GDSL-type esterase/lipase family protein n=1 Tax=Neptuniibacter sp. TaxID=1962643 RepID=UPI002611932F
MRYIVSVFFYVFFLISPTYAMDLPEPVVLQDGSRQWIITTLLGKSENRISYEYIVNGESICSSTVQTELYSDLYPRAILNNGNPILVWSGIKKNNGDSDIYYAEWESTFSDCKDSWSPTRMVHPDNTLSDMAPELTYDSEGNIQLIWQRNTGRHIEQQTATFLDGAFEVDTIPLETQSLPLNGFATGFYAGMPIRLFQEPLNCIAFGDSITQGLKRNSSGYISPECKDPSGGAEACSYTEELSSALEQENDVSTAAEYNWGVSGERSYQGVARIEAVMADQSNANCILIMYGANDLYQGLQPSDTAANIQTMAELALSVNKVPVIATVTANTAGTGSIVPYNDAIWQMVADVGLLPIEIADQYTALNENWELYNSGDGLHVSDAGDQRMSEEWLRALKENPALFSVDHDGDGILTTYEDADSDGDPRNDDCDQDSLPDYLDTDPCDLLCGNGVIDPGEQCDDGNTLTELCAYGLTSCTVCDSSCDEVAGAVSYCGDTQVDPLNGETCDDGGESASCDSDCTSSVCGDGSLNISAGEACDDGNTVDNDGCSTACQEEICGDGIIQATESCDDGNTLTELCVYGLTNCTVCDSSCDEVAGAVSYCGDTQVDPL